MYITRHRSRLMQPLPLGLNSPRGSALRNRRPREYSSRMNRNTRKGALINRRREFRILRTFGRLMKVKCYGDHADVCLVLISKTFMANRSSIYIFHLIMQKRCVEIYSNLQRCAEIYRDLHISIDIYRGLLRSSYK